MSDSPAGPASELEEHQDSATSSDESTEATDLESALADARAEVEQLREQHLRAVAELDNQRKRADREIENARRYGIERFAGELLAVVDSLEMGLEAGADASAETLLEGKRATLRQLRAALEKFGIEVVDPAGENFDPQLHEAMTMQPSDTAEPGSVLAVIQKGYMLNGRLLRPARVVVAAEAPEENG